MNRRDIALSYNALVGIVRHAGTILLRVSEKNFVDRLGYFTFLLNGQS